MIEKTNGALDRLKAIKAAALDMDGTTYLGDRLLGGASELFDLLASKGKPCVFLTNNSSRSRREYEEKLNRLGLRVGPGSVMTSGEATIRLLQRKYPKARVFLVATPSFEAEVRQAGIEVLALEAATSADVAVLAYDTGLTFQKLAALCTLVRSSVPFIATHPDINCPVDGGFLPDVGAFLACIRASTGRSPDLIVGKPSTLMVEALCEKLGLPASQITYIGDRLYTDVAMARASGMLSVLVLSGETRIDDLESSEIQPDLVATGLDEIAQAIATYP